MKIKDKKKKMSSKTNEKALNKEKNQERLFGFPDQWQ